MNYYNRFFRNLPSLKPLFELLENGRKFNWTMNYEAAFQGVKDELVSDKVLIHYDPSLPLLLVTDASPIGMGAILSHKMPTEKFTNTFRSKNAALCSIYVRFSLCYWVSEN
jgi:hypothetical protein